MELQSSAETMKQHPREFTFRVVDGHSNRTLTVTYEVMSRDTRP